MHLGNQKHFLLFLLYSVLICVYTDLLAGPFVYRQFLLYSQQVAEEEVPGAELLLLPITLALSGLLQTVALPLIVGYFQWALWLGVLHDRTTLEDMYEDSEDESDSESDPAKEFSRLERFQKVFGQDRRLWPLPIDSTDFDALFRGDQ